MASPKGTSEDLLDTTPDSPKKGPGPKQAGSANKKPAKGPVSCIMPEEMTMSLPDFINHKVRELGSIKLVIEFLKDNKITASLVEIPDSEHSKHLMHVQYMGECQLWMPDWARQSRGSVLALISGIWVMDRCLMERAPELVLPGYHQTQDSTNHTSAGDFPAHIQTAMNDLESNTFTGPVALHAKMDGIGVVIQMINSDAPSFPLHVAHLSSTKCSLNKMLFEACAGMNLIIRVSTIGSSGLSSELSPYIVQVLIVGMKIQTEEEFAKQAQLLTPIGMITPHIGVLIAKFMQFRDECSGRNNWTAVFEGIVPNNQPKFPLCCKISGLACSSENTKLIFLGSSEPSTGFISSSHTNQTVCDTPACFLLPPPTERSLTMVSLLQNLDQVTTGQISEEDFFNACSSIGSQIWSPEGFIANVTSPSGTPLSFKLKSNLYNDASKLSIEFATGNTVTAKFFPIFEIVKKFLSCTKAPGSAVVDSAVVVSDSDVVASDSAVVDSAGDSAGDSASAVVVSDSAGDIVVAVVVPPIIEIAQKIQEVFILSSENPVFSSLPGKVQTTIATQSTSKQVAIIANSPAGIEQLFMCFKQGFPVPIPNTKDMKQDLKNLIMKLDPITQGFEERLLQAFTPDTSGDPQRRLHMAFKGEVQAIVRAIMNL